MRSISRLLAPGPNRPVGSVCLECRAAFRLRSPQTQAYSTTGVRRQQGHVEIPAIRQPDHGAAPPANLPSAGIARLQSRRLLSVSGADAAKHLHGLITKNVVNGLPHHAGFYAAFLNAKGRVLHDVFVYPRATLGAEGNAKLDESFLIDVDAEEVQVLWAHLKRYRLRQKVFLRVLERDEASVWQAWADEEPGRDAGARREGDTPKRTPAEKLALQAEAARQEGIHIVEDTRAPGMGYRFVVPGGPPPSVFRLPSAHQSAYRVRRYLRGVPEGQGEILYEQALPLESNMDLMDGIDFHKGCYIGQELTIRTKHRGVVRKRTLPCTLFSPEAQIPETLEYRPEVQVTVPSTGETEGYDGAKIPPDTSINRDGKAGRAAGKWLHGVGNLGLGLCRLEVMTDISVPGMPDVATGDPNGGFSIETRQEDAGATAEEGEELAGKAPAGRHPKGAYRDPYIGPKLRVKAFVPDWVREGLSSENAK